MTGHSERAASFTDPETYDTVRPGWTDALGPVLHGWVGNAVDLGSGTGKMLDMLLTRGGDTLQRRTIAIEPNPEFSVYLRENYADPEVRVRERQAHDTGLPNGVVDLAVSGQSWHWFDERATVDELHRILRPGARVIVAWNVRDARTPWVRDLTRALHLRDTLPHSHREPQFDDRFEPVTHWRHRWFDRLMSPSDLLTLAETRSHTITADPATRTQIRRAVTDVIERSLHGHHEVFLPYITHVYSTWKR